MGSHYSFCIDIADQNHTLEAQIAAVANARTDFSQDCNFVAWCWRRFSPETKWSGGHDVTVALSKAFPEVIFRVQCRGDANYTAFILNGNTLYDDEVFVTPPFPSRPLFRRQLTNKLARQQKAEVERKQAEEARRHKDALDELERLRKRTAELEAQLVS
jgi:hypothetical protein